MANIPSSQDLFDAGYREVLVQPTSFNPVIALTEGSDVNLALNVSRAMAEECLRFGQAAFDETHLGTAAKVGGEVLARWLFDNFGLTTQDAQAAAVPLVFTRTGTTGFTYSAGSVVGTPGGITYAILNDLPFPAGVTGPLTVTGVCQITGPQGNVDAGTITEIISTSEDETLTVTNLEPAAGGTNEESDQDFTARGRDFFLNARRGTRRAIESGAVGTPGVSRATAIELLDPESAEPGFRGSLVISDDDGRSNQALADRVLLALAETRCLGVPVNVVAGVPQFVSISIDGLLFSAGANTATVIQQARAAILAAVNTLAPNQTLRRAQLFAALDGIDLLEVPAGAITEPAGDLVPASGFVIRTTGDRISINE